jgi:hypothetical protein
MAFYLICTISIISIIIIATHIIDINIIIAIFTFTVSYYFYTYYYYSSYYYYLNFYYYHYYISDILSGILSDILSGRNSGICPGISEILFFACVPAAPAASRARCELRVHWCLETITWVGKNMAAKQKTINRHWPPVLLIGRGNQCGPGSSSSPGSKSQRSAFGFPNLLRFV